MGGFFGITSKKDCVQDVYFGVDYHSHLGKYRAGMATVNEKGEFMAAVFSPGIGISADALCSKAAQLPMIEIKKPKSILINTAKVRLSSVD